MIVQRMKYAGFFLITLAILGCATDQSVPPTYEEIQAVKPFKKTIAIYDFTELPSSLRGVNDIAVSELENSLGEHFTIVSGPSLKPAIRQTINEADAINAASEFGHINNVDYVAMGNVCVALTGPDVGYSEHTDKDGKFSGRVWETTHVSTDVTLKIVDVSSGSLVYSSGKTATGQCETNSQYFDDHKHYKRAVEARQIGNFAKFAFEVLTQTQEAQMDIVIKSLRDVMKKFRKDIQKNFAHSGEVMEIISNNEVMINLGSAYGIKAGDKLVIWQTDSSMTDPKTGLPLESKTKKVVLKVSKVTSGISCIAKASESDVAKVRVGDKVSNY